MSETAPTRLQVEDLRVVATESKADIVDEVSFSLGAGQTLGLVGESGSGKTTVGLALLGHARRGLRIDAGKVVLEGEDVLAMTSEQLVDLRGKRIAYVPQDPSSALNPAFKVGAQLREVLVRAARRGKSRHHEDRLAEVLSEVRLGGAGVLESYPHQLSGGQQQRAMLAMAFVLRPAVIVLDEPTTGLDVTTQRHILDTIRDLCDRRGVAAIFVTHDLAVISGLADQVAVMYAGRIVELGGTHEVFGAPRHPYARGLLRALPSPERSHALIGLEGQPPRPGARPRGCFFAPRCPFCQLERCTVAQPPLESGDATDHLVRCVRVHELPERDTADDAHDRPSSLTAGDGALLWVAELHASYGEIPVVHDASFELQARECVAIVGESGSGKTTLARCIVGLHRRWSGEVRWHGAPLSTAARHRPIDALRRIQYIFQNPYASLNPRKRIHQIMEQPLDRFFSLNRRDRRHRVLDALDAAALDASFLEHFPAELSGGERQRVAIARALVTEPEILVCDEITSALDVSVQAAIIETLRRLQTERGVSLIFITHNLALVRSIARRIIVMQKGHFVEQGTADSVLDRPKHQYTQALLADLPRLESETAADR